MNTKLILFISLEKLLKQKDFDKIMVKEIAETANVSRATFYRHFHDKYDLANWYYRFKAEQVFEEKTDQGHWAIFYGLSQFMGQDDHTFMQVMMNEHGQNAFFDFVTSSFYNYWVNQYQETPGHGLSKEEKFTLELWSNGGAYYWKHILNANKTIDPEELADLFLASMPVFLTESKDNSEK